MQSRGTPDWLRGRGMAWVDWAVALCSPQMADERQAAVLGQVSSAALSLVIWLNYAAGLAFMLAGGSRFRPCAWVFLGIALGARAFTTAAARRQSVDPRTSVRVPSRGRIAFSSVAFGAGFVALERLLPGAAPASWRNDLLTGAVAALGWAFLFTRGQNQKQKAARPAEATAAGAGDDPPAA